MRDPYNYTFARRLKYATKLLLDSTAYLLIRRKPKAMIQVRDADRVFTPVRDAIEAQRKDIDALRKTLEPLARDYDDLVLNGALTESGHFGQVDARTAYAMVRHFKPQTIFEVGCGQSTHVMRRALDDNGSGRIVCVDPMPRKDISAVAHDITYASVLDVQPEHFLAAQAGDIVFIDGSHFAFNGTDVAYLFIDVLPRLAPGVIVHVHDICLPYEYDALFTERLYNEQYVLAPMVLDQASWGVLAPNYADIKDGHIKGEEPYRSFWMQKR